MTNSKALAGLAVIAALFLGTPLLIYAYGIPWLAALAASAVPVAWEEELGRLSATQLSAGRASCSARPAQAVMDRLSRAAPDHPYHLTVQVVDASEVNAFAAPGGAIVVLNGLLARMGSSDEFAAVLAHEAVHVLRRHTTKSLIREVSLAFLLSYVAGDAAGMLSAAAGALGGLRYQRRDEAEADRDGMLLLAGAGLDPQAMPRMLERLHQASPSEPRLPAWISSHPDIERRVAEARRRLPPQTTGRGPALRPEDWAALRNSCRLRPE